MKLDWKLCVGCLPLLYIGVGEVLISYSGEGTSKTLAVGLFALALIVGVFLRHPVALALGMAIYLCLALVSLPTFGVIFDPVYIFAAWCLYRVLRETRAKSRGSVSASLRP